MTATMIFPRETVGVLNEIGWERKAQDDKWGEQNHPDGTGGAHYEAKAQAAKMTTDLAAEAGEVTFADILTEEFYEALAESDPAKLRVELIQVAAVAASWVEAIDRREQVAA